jgi:riboflavin kinase/FMN adenylyltransferase
MAINNVTTQLIRGLGHISTLLGGCVATIGNFDGVHLGHQALLSNVVKTAKSLGLPSLVITFEPQPLEYLIPQKSVPRLTRLREKFYLLSKAGIDNILIIRFDEDFARLTADEFIQSLLIDKLKVKHLIVGDDFRFGRGRQGDIALLKEAGLTVETQTDIIIDSERVSSTRVRQALLSGDHALAHRLLGRSYFMMGRVVHGNKLGRVLGYPTANIYLHRKASPVMGIYVVKMHGLTKKPLPGVANIGIRPTIGGTRSLLEVHIFNFNQSIYGKYVSVEFCHKLRDEERYESLDALKAQIDIDAEQAREYFIKQGSI